jgi:hypothetical protein
MPGEPAQDRGRPALVGAIVEGDRQTAHSVAAYPSVEFPYQRL